MHPIGYQWLIERFNLDVLPLQFPARLGPSGRIEKLANEIRVPNRLALDDDADALDHLLFAFKHEDMNLAVAMAAMPHISAARLREQFVTTPTGAFIRLACFFWEAATGQELIQNPVVQGGYVSVFDEEKFVTGPTRSVQRWRVRFNGLGTLKYCATVRRTPLIEAELAASVLDRVNAAVAGMDAALRDRALEWAYLSETRGSFAIENEVPAPSKQAAFVNILRQAHLRQPLDEDYLAQLQNTVITNPLDQAVAFRHEQNYLARGGTGSLAVTYIPPPPELARELMEELMTWLNDGPTDVPAMVAGAIGAFGFVFIHPFMDGNGRLSRYLMHHVLCTTGALANGLVLPMSVAMKANERDYLAALEAFSKPMKKLWDVQWLHDDEYNFQYKGELAFVPYRYWDATQAVEFSLKMADVALNEHLRSEAEFLMRFDAAFAAVNQAVDIRSKDLVVLLRGALQNNGVVSANRRAQYSLTVPEATFDLIQAEATKAMEQ